jgi:hypothetical protein
MIIKVSKVLTSLIFFVEFSIIQGFGLMIPNHNQYPSWNGLDL